MTISITMFIDINSHSEHIKWNLFKPSWKATENFLQKCSESFARILALKFRSSFNMEHVEIKVSDGVMKDNKKGLVRWKNLQCFHVFRSYVVFVHDGARHFVVMEKLVERKRGLIQVSHKIHVYILLGTFSAITSFWVRRPPKLTWLAPFSSLADSRFAAAIRWSLAKSAIVFLAVKFFCLNSA